MTTKATKKCTFSGGKTKVVKHQGACTHPQPISFQDFLHVLADITHWENIWICHLKCTSLHCVCFMRRGNTFTVCFAGLDAGSTCLTSHRETALRGAGLQHWQRTNTFSITHTHRGSVSQAGEGRDCQCHSEWKWTCQSQMSVPPGWYMSPDHTSLNYQECNV